MFKTLEEIIVRTPALGKTDLNINNFLTNDYFKLALKHSSNSLYNKIFIKKEMTDKEMASLLTYAMRITRRSTPFGFMAGVGVCKFQTSVENAVILTEKRKLVYRYSGKSIFVHRSNDQNHIINDNCYLYTNPTINLQEKKMNYFEIITNDFQYEYQFSEIYFDKHLFRFLKFFRPKSFFPANEAIEFFEKAGFSKEEAVNSILDLVKINVLLSKNGISCYDRLTNCFLNFQSNTFSEKEIIQKEITSDEYHIDLGVDIKKITLSENIIKSLNEVIQFSLTHLSSYKSELMKEFIDLFEKRYNNQIVSLLEVFNPETGINYKSQTGLRKMKSQFDIIRKTKQSLVLNDWDLKLINIIRQNGNNNEPIKLDSQEILEYNSNIVLPSSLNANFKIINDNGLDKIYLKYIAGPTALSLLNRFSNSVEGVEDVCKKVSNHDKNYYGENILVCDISFLLDDKSFNVLNRRNFYDYYIDALGGSDNYNDTKKIPISDLYLKIEDKKLVLFSMSLKKQVIPINSTAFNANISNFPIYKFLCDYQSYYYNISPNFHWGNLSLLYNCLPRVEFKNVIIYPKSWLITLKIIKKYIDNNSELRNKLVDIGIDKKFILKEGDRELLVDIDNELSLLTFGKIIRRSKNEMLILTEYLENSIIKSDNHSFEGEFLLPILIDSKISKDYKLPSLNINRDKSFVANIPLFKDNWIYLEAYLNEETANKFILQLYNTVLSDLLAQNKIIKFFFLRYNTPRFHIRIRIQFQKKNELLKFLTFFNKKTEEFKEKYGVYDYLFKTYHREYDRYGKDDIDLVEQLFTNDSKFQIINFKENSNNLWVLPILIIDGYLSLFKYCEKEKMQLLKKWVEILLFDVKNKKYFQNKSSGIFREIKSTLLSNEINLKINSLKSTIKGDIDINFINNKKGLHNSIIHMSLNRYFEFDNLNNELMAYKLCIKYLKMRLALKILSSER